MSVPEASHGEMQKFFHEWREEASRPVAYQPVYVDIVSRLNPDAKNDIAAGLLLSQILYWCLPGQDGKQRLRVQKDGHYWIAKNRDEWYQETRLTKERMDRALAVLEKAGLIIRHNYLFSGKRTAHIRLISIVFLTAFYEVVYYLPGGVEKADLVYSGKSLPPVAVEPGDWSSAFTAIGHGNKPLLVTEITAETTSNNTTHIHTAPAVRHPVFDDDYDILDNFDRDICDDAHDPFADDDLAEGYIPSKQNVVTTQEAVTARKEQYAEPKSSAGRLPAAPVEGRDPKDMVSVVSQAKWQPDDFNAVYEAYPKAGERKQSIIAWEHLRPNKVFVALLLECVTCYADYCVDRQIDRQYIGTFNTWLNNERWDNEECRPEQ